MPNNNKDENDILTILKYHDDELKKLQKHKLKKFDDTIAETEKLLEESGYDIEKDIKKVKTKPNKEKTIYVPSWDELLNNAKNAIGTEANIEDLFSEKELIDNRNAINILNKEFNSIHKLDQYDISIAVMAGIISSVVDILLIGIPTKGTNGLKAGNLSNYIRDYFEKKFPEEEMGKLASSKISKVPFDAQDNRHTTVNVEGLSSYYHRMLQLGHDPILGLIFGVSDILNGTMTTIDKKGKVVIQVIETYNGRKESDIFEAISKLFIHFTSDITTSMGLPVPLMSLFNFLQFGKIGEYEQTIAEIVQGMYYEGYDFIHFCSMSIPVMLVEVITRIGYAFKKIREGNSVKDSIPFSLNRENNPKLATMLFLGHTSASAINIGKIAFTKNPMAINYPQWMAFLKYSYTQLKWSIVNKPKIRDKFVMNKIDNELYDMFDEIEKTFNEYTKNCIVIMN